MTERKQLEYINRTCNTDYKSMEEVDWDCISMCHKLSEDFIREFKDKVDWLWISTNQLSENFIREFQDYVYWVQISIYQKLSEDFIREFKDKVDWGFIFDYQTLSEDFIQEFKELMIEYNDKQYTTHTETVSVEALESKDDKNMEDNISKTLTEQEEIEKLGNALKEFIYLPNLEGDLKSTSLEDDYNPTLYKYDGLWCVDWISSEGDSIKSFEHENIIEVIKQASQWINENFSDSGD